jgi:hypothetical protein
MNKRSSGSIAQIIYLILMLVEETNSESELWQPFHKKWFVVNTSV